MVCYFPAGYRPAELGPCMQSLLELHQLAAASDVTEANQPICYIREKFSQDCWLAVAMHPTGTDCNKLAVKVHGGCRK